jgi:hypothetical protein
MQGEDLLQQLVGGGLSNDRLRLLEKRLTGLHGAAGDSAGDVVLDSQGRQDGSDVVQDSIAQTSQDDQLYRAGKGPDQHDSKRRRLADGQADKLGASSKQRASGATDQLPRMASMPEAASAQPSRPGNPPAATTLPISPPHALNLGERGRHSGRSSALVLAAAVPADRARRKGAIAQPSPLSSSRHPSQARQTRSAARRARAASRPPRCPRARRTSAPTSPCWTAAAGTRRPCWPARQAQRRRRGQRRGERLRAAPPSPPRCDDSAGLEMQP